MRFAVLADTHLSKDAPERLEVFAWVLSDAVSKGIETVVVAGDFCEGAPFPYEEIRQVCGGFEGLDIYVLLGNHDMIGDVFSDRYVGLENFISIDRPIFLPGTDNTLLLPYQEGISMGQALFSVDKEFAISKRDWLLISHGDFLYGGIYYDDAGYFPITPLDLSIFRPSRVILGHIHSAPSYDDLGLLYCGSAYPVSSNETGLRRYAIVDSQDFSVEWRVIGKGPIYWSQELAIYDNDELEGALSRMWADLEATLAARPDWVSALHLSLRLNLYLGQLDTSLIIDNFFRDKPVASLDLDVVPVALPERYAGLVDMFRQEVDLLCSEGAGLCGLDCLDIKDKVLRTGLELFSERVLRRR